MQINKGNILKSIESFIGADNELAIKEAEHQIKVFKVVFQKEVEIFQELGNEDEKNLNPENEQENILILEAIEAFKKAQVEKKNKKKKEEKMRTAILGALEARYEAQILEADATLKIYLENSVGIGEHPQHIDEVDKLIEKIAAAEEKIKVLQQFKL